MCVMQKFKRHFVQKENHYLCATVLGISHPFLGEPNCTAGRMPFFSEDSYHLTQPTLRGYANTEEQRSTINGEKMSS